MICPKCGYCEEKTEAKKQTDEEFFLEWWTPTIGLEAAKASWEEKQVAIGRETDRWDNSQTRKSSTLSC